MFARIEQLLAPCIGIGGPNHSYLRSVRVHIPERHQAAAERHDRDGALRARGAAAGQPLVHSVRGDGLATLLEREREAANTEGGDPAPEAGAPPSPNPQRQGREPSPILG